MELHFDSNQSYELADELEKGEIPPFSVIVGGNGGTFVVKEIEKMFIARGCGNY